VLEPAEESKSGHSIAAEETVHAPLIRHSSRHASLNTRTWFRRRRHAGGLALLPVPTKPRSTVG